MASAAMSRVRWARTNVAELLVEARRSLCQDFAMNVHYLESWDGSRFPRTETAIAFAVWFARALLCALTEHTVEVTGHANGDFAHEEGHCTRCGKTLFDHWYY